MRRVAGRRRRGAGRPGPGAGRARRGRHHRDRRRHTTSRTERRSACFRRRRRRSGEPRRARPAQQDVDPGPGGPHPRRRSPGLPGPLAPGGSGVHHQGRVDHHRVPRGHRQGSGRGSDRRHRGGGAAARPDQARDVTVEPGAVDRDRHHPGPVQQELAASGLGRAAPEGERHAAAPSARRRSVARPGRFRRRLRHLPRSQRRRLLVCRAARHRQAPAAGAVPGEGRGQRVALGPPARDDLHRDPPGPARLARRARGPDLRRPRRQEPHGAVRRGRGGPGAHPHHPGAQPGDGGVHRRHRDRGARLGPATLRPGRGHHRPGLRGSAVVSHRPARRRAGHRPRHLDRVRRQRRDHGRGGQAPHRRPEVPAARRARAGDDLLPAGYRGQGDQRVRGGPAPGGGHRGRRPAVRDGGPQRAS